MQCVAALVLGTWGVLGLQGSFLPIRTTEVLGKQCARGDRPPAHRTPAHAAAIAARATDSI